MGHATYGPDSWHISLSLDPNIFILGYHSLFHVAIDQCCVDRPGPECLLAAGN